MGEVRSGIRIDHSRSVFVTAMDDKDEAFPEGPNGSWTVEKLTAYLKDHRGRLSGRRLRLVDR